MDTLDTTVGEDPEEDILQILGHLRPNWAKEQIAIKVCNRFAKRKERLFDRVTSRLILGNVASKLDVLECKNK